MTIKAGTDPGTRIVDSPFELRELAALSRTGVIVGTNGDDVARVSQARVILEDFVEDDFGARKDFDRSWHYLERNEMSHRFELAYLLTMSWVPDEGAWESILDGMAKQ